MHTYSVCTVMFVHLCMYTAKLEIPASCTAHARPRWQSMRSRRAAVSISQHSSASKGWNKWAIFRVVMAILESHSHQDQRCSLLLKLQMPVCFCFLWEIFKHNQGFCYSISSLPTIFPACCRNKHSIAAVLLRMHAELRSGDKAGLETPENVFIPRLASSQLTNEMHYTFSKLMNMLI